MSLTGSLVPVVLALAALVLFVVIVRPRAARPGVLATVWRAAQVLGLNVLTVALSAVLLNDSYLFYVSWADLLPAPDSAASIGRGATGPLTSTLPSGLRFLSDTAPLPRLPQPGARQQVFTVTGRTSGVTGHVLVQLPTDYDPRSRRTYPVIEALHGWPGGPGAVAHEIDLRGRFQRLIDEHKLADPIVLMPQINTPLNLDTECVNPPPGGGGPHTLTWIGHDVPQWAADHFRVAHARTSWAVLGASYGGWCAANAGMHYPGTFGAVVSFMGYLAPEFYGYRPFANDPEGLETYDLTRLAHVNPPPVAMWLMASKEDRGAYGALVPFLHAARAPPVGDGLHPPARRP